MDFQQLCGIPRFYALQPQDLHSQISSRQGALKIQFMQLFPESYFRVGEGHEVFLEEVQTIFSFL